MSWAQAAVDHLNEQKNDNRHENLVVSCKDCNMARGSILPFLARMRPEVVSVFVSLATDWNTKHKVGPAVRIKAAR